MVVYFGHYIFFIASLLRFVKNGKIIRIKMDWISKAHFPGGSYYDKCVCTIMDRQIRDDRKQNHNKGLSVTFSVQHRGNSMENKKNNSNDIKAF